MGKLTAILKWLRVDGTEPDIALAQFAEHQRQIPFLYALLIVNACAVAYTHYGLAPDRLIAPILVMVLTCALRLVIWLRRRRVTVEAPEAIAHLRQAIVLTALLAVAFVTWSLCLDGYGGPYERGHVAMFIAITVLGCIFCLMHLPQAALVATVIVTIPYLVYYLSMGNTVFFAIAVNIFLVTAVMLKVLFNSYRGFTTLVRSRAEMRRLSDENARLAHTDSLTGLPNRRYFFARLESQIETAAATGARFAVGVLDLFYLADLLYQPSRSGDMHTLREIKLIEAHLGLRRSYANLVAAQYFAALIETITETGTPVPGEFELFGKALGYLSGTEVSWRAVERFENRMLTLAGIAHAEQDLPRAFQALHHKVPALRDDLRRLLAAQGKG